MKLSGSTVLLTGAAGGLGRAIAWALAASGADLVLADKPGAEPIELAAELEGHGGRAWTVSADLAARGGAEELASAATEAAGPIDVLVNNAGLEFVGSFLRHEDEELEAIAHVNLIAPAELIRELLPGMIDRGRGHVVNMGSLAGRLPSAYNTSYTMTKHGIVALTHSLRSEYADEPIGFSVVCPGFVSAAGMYGRHEGAVGAPGVLGTIPPERVGKAVVRAVKKDKAELIVNSRPVRPIIGLAALAPRAASRLSRSGGVDDVWRQIGERKGRIT